jgi:hypothetical protein
MGEPRLARVYRVGSVGTLAGGVLEWAAWTVFVLQVVLVPSGGGVLQSATTERLLVRARDPPLDLDAADPVDDPEAPDVGSRRRYQRSRVEAPRSLRSGDYPAAWGHLPIQG